MISHDDCVIEKAEFRELVGYGCGVLWALCPGCMDQEKEVGRRELARGGNGSHAKNTSAISCRLALCGQCRSWLEYARGLKRGSAGRKINRSKCEDNMVKCRRCRNWIAFRAWQYVPPRACDGDRPTLPPMLMMARRTSTSAPICRRRRTMTIFPSSSLAICRPIVTSACSNHALVNVS